jgi:hypothetical protein
MSKGSDGNPDGCPGGEPLRPVEIVDQVGAAVDHERVVDELRQAVHVTVDLEPPADEVAELALDRAEQVQSGPLRRGDRLVSLPRAARQ